MCMHYSFPPIMCFSDVLERCGFDVDLVKLEEMNTCRVMLGDTIIWSGAVKDFQRSKCGTNSLITLNAVKPT